MKIELCLITVNALAGLAEVTWYLQSLPGEKKVKFFLYFTANKEDKCKNYRKVVFAGLTSLTFPWDCVQGYMGINGTNIEATLCY